MQHRDTTKYDLICAGGGIMSATFALLLKQLKPDAKILIFERLGKVAQESTEVMNNAGTGHSAFCEMNYTPEKKNGDIDISKAKTVFENFEKSKQFWAYLIKEGLIEDPKSFIHSIPHFAWVKGENNVEFLKKRFETMTQSFAFEDMDYTEDSGKMKDWFPLLMQGRNGEDKMAATKVDKGTEINFESITKQIYKILETKYDTPVIYHHEVSDVDPSRSNKWILEVRDLQKGEYKVFDAEHVFIGAGGGSLPLLKSVEIDEKSGYGGFPVSGQWLVCNNRDVIEKHHAKVYSKAGVGDPPMSVPHLDTRYVDGEKQLIFGPFAGFNTKFLKEGSYTDLPNSINWDNIPSMWGAFWKNLPLTKYLIEQISMGHEDRMNELRNFIKDAKSEDWDLRVAGQRVQVIKRDKKKGGVLEFGTEVVHDKNGSVTAVLGASPGASTVVSIMIKCMQIAFPEIIKSKEGKEKMNEMVPFWNTSMDKNKDEFLQVQKESEEVLELA